MTSPAPSGRPFERTHPWLNFAFDTRRLKHTDWLALGECAAMCERIAGAPLDPAVARDMLETYLAKGALATAAIEGNTLTEDEARAHIDGELELPPSRRSLGQEIDNIVKAYDVLLEELERTGRIALTVESIERMNRMVLRDLAVEEHVIPGRIRTANVTVGSYRCPDHGDAGYLLGQLCRTLARFSAPDENRRAFAVLKAVFAHLYLAWIHPFGDGNGRTARLVEVAILLEAGLPQPVCHLPSNHYNLTRTGYYRQLSRASKAENGLFGFVSYAIEGLADGLREQIDAIREHQWDVAWIDFIHREFGHPSSRTELRRRALAVALARIRGPVKARDLPNLNAPLAREYARVSVRTLMRDVSALAARGLLVPGREGVRSNRERVLAFLPWQNDPEDAGRNDGEAASAGRNRGRRTC